MSPDVFLKPILNGDRFNGGAIPLDVLADFAILNEMMIEIAKWKYLEAHEERSRVPRRFTDSVSLKLVGVEEGSAKPIIKLIVAAAMAASQAPEFMVEARRAMVSAVGAAERGETITDHLPPKFLSYFDRFGRSLGEGESITFAGEANIKPATLTRESRRQLILASSVEEVTQEVSVRGMIPEVDQLSRTFQLLLANGSTIQRIPLDNPHYDTILEISDGYRQGKRVRLTGMGVFNRSQKLTGIREVEQMTILEALDIDARIDDLKQLRNGWHDGVGKAPEIAHLDWIAAALKDNLSDDIQLPYLFPTNVGGIRAEWCAEPFDVSLDVALGARTAYWHSLDVTNDVDEEKDLDLTKAADWVWLIEQLRAKGAINR
jgi:hypothetical protein